MAGPQAARQTHDGICLRLYASGPRLPKGRFTMGLGTTAAPLACFSWPTNKTLRWFDVSMNLGVSVELGDIDDRLGIRGFKADPSQEVC